MRFVSRIAIRFSDLDPFGHVNHARYLTYCEDSRTEFFSKMAAESGSHLLRSGFLVAHVDCDYYLPVGLDAQVVTVSCGVKSLGQSSIRLRYEIYADQSLAASLQTVLVVTDAQGQSRPLSAPEREFLTRYLLNREDASATPCTGADRAVGPDDRFRDHR